MPEEKEKKEKAPAPAPPPPVEEYLEKKFKGMALVEKKPAVK